MSILLTLAPDCLWAQSERPEVPPKDPGASAGSSPVPSASLRWTDPPWAIGLIPGGTFRSNLLTNPVVFRGELSGVVSGTAVTYSLLLWNKVDGAPSTSTLAEGSLNLENDGPFTLPEIRVPADSEAVLTVTVNEPSGAVTGVRWWLSTKVETPAPSDEPKDGPVIVLKRVDPPFSVGQQVVLQGDGEPRSVIVEGVLSDPGSVRSLVLRRSSAPEGADGRSEAWMEMAGTESVSWAEDGAFQVGPIAFGPGEHRLVLVAENNTGGRTQQPLDIRYVRPVATTNPDKEPGNGSELPLPQDPREGTEDMPLLKLGASISPEATDENRPLVFVFAKLSQPAPRGGIQVDLRQVGGNAELDRDYRMETNRVTIAEGDMETVFRLEVLDDAETEPEETVEWEVRPTDTANTALSPARVSMRLSDNEGPGEVRLIWTAFIVNEAAGTAQVRLARTGNHQLPGAVAYQISGDPALVEYLGAGTQGRVAFGVGDSQATIALPLPQDDQPQPMRQLKIQLSDPEGGMTLGSMSTARLDVRDDDSPPVADPQSARHHDLQGKRGLSVTLATERGFRYVIEYTESPTSNEWKELTVLFGNNSEQSAWDSSEQGGSRFYRYRVENEPLTLLTD